MINTESNSQNESRDVLVSSRAILWTVVVALGVLGLIFVIFPFFSLSFRDEELFLTGQTVLPVSIGVGLIVLGFSIPYNLGKSGFWFFLTLVGQAVCIQLVNAGPGLKYQHFKSFDELLSGQNKYLAAFLLTQALIVGIALVRRLKSGREFFKGRIRLWHLLIIAVVFLLPTATVSENVYFYVYEWFFAGFVQIVQLGSIVLFGLSLPEKLLISVRNVLNLLTADTEKSSKRLSRNARRLIIALAMWAVILPAFLNQVSYRNHPHVPDEVAYLMHARLFASGRLTVPAPSVPEAFETYLFTFKDGVMYPAPPPGWPLFLALGSFFGLPWLVNPILAGVNVILAYKVLAELYSRRTAIVGTILLALSPWYLFLGMSFMTHMAALTCALVSILGVAYARRTGHVRWGWIAGIALGILALIRPLEAVGMAGLLGLWSIGLWGKRISVVSISGLILGSIFLGCIGLVYNNALTGNPTKFPIMEYSDKEFGPNANAYGFGPDRGMNWAIDPNPGHGTVDALINSNLNATQINTELFGWGIGSFLLIGIFFCVATVRKSDYLMMALVAIIYLLHFFYYFSGGPDFGARYWFLMILPLVALSGRAIVSAFKLLESVAKGAGIRFLTCISALFLIAFLNFIPWRAIDKYHNFRGMRPDFRYLMNAHDFNNSLVLIQGNQHPEFDSAMVYNSIDIDRSKTVFAWDGGKDIQRRLFQAFPEKRIWIIKCPSVTGRGFEVIGGTKTGREMLEQGGQ